MTLHPQATARLTISDRSPVPRYVPKPIEPNSVNSRSRSIRRGSIRGETFPHPLSEYSEPHRVRQLLSFQIPGKVDGGLVQPLRRWSRCVLLLRRLPRRPMQRVLRLSVVG